MGIPAVVIGTDEFAQLVTMEAEQRGLPGLHRVALPHPIGGIKPPAVIAKVKPALAEVIAHLTEPA
jgi:hypothetical protein